MFLATNRFICEIYNKGFQRNQNLQLHKRGHNLPWKLKQRNNKEVIKKKVYICPEKNCVHHDPSRALGDLTGIKKHFSRKHGEKKWKCDKCSKKYAVQSDRKDNFITHRAFCDALAEESARSHVFRPPQNELMVGVDAAGNHHQLGLDGQKPQMPLWLDANNATSSPATAA
nr:protein indeterminate-domain 9-like isoform X2 [Ipomoea trifida]GLL24950.1 protein indeterminate-domain 9-like isoform X2 [Ipomoea trifida]